MNASNGICRLVVEGDLGIASARDLRDRLLAAFDQGAAVEVDLSQVTEIDSAGIQLLVAAQREALVRNKTLRMVDSSPPVQDILKLCELGAFFDQPACTQ